VPVTGKQLAAMALAAAIAFALGYDMAAERAARDTADAKANLEAVCDEVNFVYKNADADERDVLQGAKDQCD